MASSPAKIVPAEIHFGRVVEVDPDRWTCRVICDDPPREFDPTFVPSSFLGVRGEGVHAMPEVGARVFVAKPSDRGHPFIVSYAYTMGITSEDGQKPGSFHSERPYLNPGDIVAVSRDNNGVVIRRGGLVEVRSTPLARTIFNPQGNQILTIAENWEVETFGGKISWRNLQPEDDRDGELASLYQQDVRQYVDSPSATLRVQMGSTDGDRVELDAPVALPPLVSVPTQVTLLAAGTLAPQPITIPVQRPSAADPAARVVDVRVFEDERAEESPESLALGISRQGAVLLETAQKVRISKDSDSGNSEPVLRGTSFLTELANALTELSVGLNSVGVPTPVTDALVVSINQSVLQGAPFLSSTLESE